MFLYRDIHYNRALLNATVRYIPHVLRYLLESPFLSCKKGNLYDKTRRVWLHHKLSRFRKVNVSSCRRRKMLDLSLGRGSCLDFFSLLSIFH